MVPRGSVVSCLWGLVDQENFVEDRSNNLWSSGYRDTRRLRSELLGGGWAGLLPSPVGKETGRDGGGEKVWLEGTMTLSSRGYDEDT